LKKGTPPIKWLGGVSKVFFVDRVWPAQADMAKHKTAINVLLEMMPGLMQAGTSADLIFHSFAT
jgi:hypothetical protein